MASSHQGTLHKLGEKGIIKTWKSRHFELRDGYMYYYKHKGESEIGRIDLSLALDIGLNTQNKGKGTFGFEIKTMDRTWVLCADSLEGANYWITAINQVIKKELNTLSPSSQKTNISSPPPMPLVRNNSSPHIQKVDSSMPTFTRVDSPVPLVRADSPIQRVRADAPPSMPRPYGQVTTQDESEYNVPPPTFPKPEMKEPPPRPMKPTAPNMSPQPPTNTPPLPNPGVRKLPPKKMNAKKMPPKGFPKSGPKKMMGGLPKTPQQPQTPQTPQFQHHTPNPTQGSPAPLPSRPNFETAPSPSEPPTESLSPEQQKAENRYKAANEILTTERYYVECLQTMQKDYMDQFLVSLRNKDKDVTYTELDIKSLFSVNLSMIIPINCELQQSLEDKMKAWDNQVTSIGESFIKVAPFFKMYLDYSNNYSHANELFKKLVKEEKFSNKINAFRENARVKLQLEHLLIMPVQRIPRYILLLTELLKYTPEGHTDQTNLNKALSLMQEVANHINNSMKKIDNYDKAANYPELVLPHRHLLWDGVIEAKSEKSKGEIKFVLFNDLFLHIPKSTPKFSKAHVLPEHQVNLVLVWTGQIITQPSGETTAEIILPKRTYQIAYNTPEEKQFYSLLQGAIVKVCGDVNPPPEERQGEHDFVDCIYKGQWRNGFMNGDGVMLYKNISEYTGTWEDNNKSGYGTMTWNTGHSYKGQWKYNSMNGEGEYRWPNNDVYIGSMADGKRNGRGSLTYGSGGAYTGDWAFDRPSGFGYFISDQATYEGDWLDGLFNGEGEYNDKLSGKQYKGSWVKGLREGKGYCTIGSGYTYNGDWKGGKKHGYGTLQIVVNEGVEMYQGGWIGDKKEGQGVYNYFDGSIYEGSWKDDMKHGYGKFTFYEKDISGRKLYEGEFAGDKMCGKGTLYFKSGEKYHGHFKENTFHGTGRLELNDVVLLEGKWSTGILEGKGNLVMNLQNVKKPISASGSFEAGAFISSQQKFDVPIPSGTSVINLPQI